MKRILVVGCFPGINGISTCICNLYKHLDRKCFECEFLVSKSDLESGYGFDALEELGAHIHSIDYSRTHFPRAARKQLKELMLSIPDLCGVHLHDIGCLNVYPIYLSQQLNFPVNLIQVHAGGGKYSTSAGMSARELAARRRVISGDSVERLACSHKAGVNAYGNLSFSVFPNATDLNRFSYNPLYRKLVRDKLKIPEEAIVIGFPGHFWTVKNPLFAVEVFMEFHRIRPDSHFILLGEGSLRDKAHKMCEEEGLLPSTHFLGYQPDIEMFMNAMDLILCTSFSEGLCNAVVEAQATGLPCLVSDGVPPEAHLTNLCEQLPLESSPTCWANKINEMLSNGASRHSYDNEIKARGYDIIDSVCDMMKIYNK